jgi:hypothetical protein
MMHQHHTFHNHHGTFSFWEGKKHLSQNDVAQYFEIPTSVL